MAKKNFLKKIKIADLISKLHIIYIKFILYKNFKNIYRYPCTEEQRNSTMGKYCGGNNNDDLQVMTDEEKLQAGFESSPSQNSITLRIF